MASQAGFPAKSKHGYSRRERQCSGFRLAVGKPCSRARGGDNIVGKADLCGAMQLTLQCGAQGSVLTGLQHAGAQSAIPEWR